MDPVTLGVVALMGAVATIGGAAEDLESDIGSQSNPNSQVQLAPQMGHLHRMINKAASGEPVAYGVWCGVAGAIAYFASKLRRRWFGEYLANLDALMDAILDNIDKRDDRLK